VIAVQILYASVHSRPKTIDEAANSGLAAVLYMVALAVLYKFTNKWTPMLLLAAAAIAGQFLFAPQYV
jgi:hypothetical protein